MVKIVEMDEYVRHSMHILLEPSEDTISERMVETSYDYQILSNSLSSSEIPCPGIIKMVVLVNQ